MKPPPPGTVERWAFDYVVTDSMEHKLAPPPLPSVWQQEAEPLLLDEPGRNPAVARVAKGPKTPGPDAMRQPRRRAELLHTFLHHELQAAELMCRSLLAFPSTPQAFRQGLLRICLDEVRHMAMYAEHLATLGFEVGQFPINDWFWSRIPASCTPSQFLAVMAMGFEGGNLDHTARFAELFMNAGDEAGAQLQRRVGLEEIPHVAFGVFWFERFEGNLDFDSWRAALPAPLSPMLMMGKPLNVEQRSKAGMSADFLERLQAWRPE